jgi:hypothetical protein
MLVVSMRCVIFLLILLICQLSHAKDPDSARAVTHVQRAVMSYSVVKGYAKAAERELFEYLPLSRQNAGYVGSIAMTAVSGQINTRRLKNLNIGFFGGNLRPDLVYNFRTGETSGLMFINWSY